jgi:4-hydroxybenzoate polyprenyltransferase
MTNTIFRHSYVNKLTNQNSTSAAGSASIFLKTIRIYQWSKNVLIFLPLFLSHRFFEIELLSTAFVAFLSLSLMASSHYIVNDLLDLSFDRMHPTKKDRPIAKSIVRKSTALLWSAILFVFSVSIGLTISLTFLKFLFIYLIVTMAYSYAIKKTVILDVLTLAFLYTLRILIGSRVLYIPFSEWLFSFSIFLFCSLGFLKRHNEIVSLSKNLEKPGEIPGRGYLLGDLSIIQMFGVTSAIASVLVFVLYINSDDVKLLYQTNYWLWLIIPMFLYWLARIWLIASRGKMNEDPIVFSIKDRIGYLILGLIIICMFLAKIGFVPL